MEVEKMRRLEFVPLGSTLVVLGIVFGQDRLIGYSFIGAGVLLSIISSFKSRRKPERQSHGTGDM
jgi:hypothetical protein